MKTNVIAIIGGEYNKRTIKELEQKYNIGIIHHDGHKVRNKDFVTMANQADCMVVVTRFIRHRASDAAKEACGNLVPMAFPNQTNADLVVQAGLQTLAS